MHVDAFADQYLFGPLGIQQREWWKTETGLPQTHAGLRLRPRDLAKIGQLCLDQGIWNVVQVVSANWIDESFKPQFGNERYGSGWWLDRFSVHGHPVFCCQPSLQDSYTTDTARRPGLSSSPDYS